MALSDNKLWDLWNAQGTDDMSRAEAFVFARVIEAEVRKQDDALILQLVEAFEYVRNTPTYQYDAKTGHRLAKEALQAGRARLEGKP